MGIDGTFFQKNYGESPKPYILDEYVTVRKFQSFFKDMTKKFEITHKFMEIHVNYSAIEKKIQT